MRVAPPLRSPVRRGAGLAPLALLLCMQAQAQAQPQPPVYESHDKSGPVFSDQATPGAARVDLPPPNVIQTGPLPVDPQAPAAAGPSYGTLAILVPANGGTVHTNTGAFQLQAQSDPALRVSAGDRFRVKIDGNLLPRAYRSSTIQVSASDWNHAATPASTAHTLELAVVDRQGQLVIAAQPVQFFVHRAAVGRR